MKDLTNRDILSPRWTNTISGEGAVAIGVKAAAGHLSLAIGTLANAGARNSGERIEYKAINTVAVGSGAEAMLDNSVAIGGGSNTNNVGTKQTSATIGNIVYSWSGGANTAKGDIVSFGSTGFERQLKNVAAGEISETSTDGINGSQLYAIAKQITNGNYLKYLGDDGQNDTTKIINLSLEKSKLNIVGGADTTKLSDENIGVVYENGNNTDPATGTELKPNDAKYQEGKLKIKLSKELTGLTSAEFKDAAGNTSKIDGNGLTITPKDTAKNPVSITNDGINAGDKAIINVASNLPEETNDNKLKQDKPTSINTNNAATVGDVLNAGWNLQGNGEAKDFVKAYDTVNFVNGDGTIATVETTDNKVSAVKYSVNLGNGLEKDGDNKITIKPADKSLEVTKDGIKVKTGDNTLTTDENGLKVNTGTISPVETGDKKGTVKVNDGDEGKIATVDTVVNAINNASFTLKASSTTDGTRNAGSSVNADGESIKAGNTVELIAGKNLDVKHDANGKITFATKEEVNFNNVQLGKDGPKLTSDGDKLKVGDKDGNPTKITNVAPGEISDTSQDAINGSQLSGVLKGINAGIASSVAMANLPQVSNIGMHRHNIAASVGVHRGESAFALGLSGLNHRGSLVYKASGALNTKGHVSFGIGIGYQFDRNTRDNDTHRNDIIDLKEKYEKLALENEQNKELIKQLLEMISKDARYNK